MTTAIFYRRVSTQEQSDSGLGLDAQTAAAKKYAKAARLTIEATFTDSVSGGAELAKRPGLAATIQVLRPGMVLLVARMDRLSRNEDMSAWIRMKVAAKNAEIRSAAGEGTDDKTPTGRLLRRIVEAFSYFERDLIKARTKAAKAEQKKRGGFIGGLVPYGFMKVKAGTRTNGTTIYSLVQNPAEQAVIGRAKELRAMDASWSQVGDTLLAEGHRPRTGDQWYLTQLQRMCK